MQRDAHTHTLEFTRAHFNCVRVKILGEANSLDWKRERASEQIKVASERERQNSKAGLYYVTRPPARPPRGCILLPRRAATQSSRSCPPPITNERPLPGRRERERKSIRTIALFACLPACAAHCECPSAHLGVGRLVGRFQRQSNSLRAREQTFASLGFAREPRATTETLIEPRGPGRRSREKFL